MKANGWVRQAVLFAVEYLLFFNQVVKKGSFRDLLMVVEIFRHVISSIVVEILGPAVDTG